MSDAPDPHVDAPLLVYVDDESSNLETFRFNFEERYALRLAHSADEALDLVRKHRVGVVIADQRMPGTLGLDLLTAVHEINPDAVGILLTAYADVDVLVASINSGIVYRYVQKPWERPELETILDAALSKHQLQSEHRTLVNRLEEMNQYLRAQLDAEHLPGQVLGESPGIRALHETIARVAQGQASVLLRGESGTGKELVARAIHETSARRDQAFVRVNCAALAPGILESELFGHERGAFTGAIGRRIGRFELADGGTLFLDEIGDLPPDVQVRLLRVLQEREFERVGGTETVRVDVRIISATNRDLEALLEQGQFREDLYYRLNVFPIDIPPLRDRVDDIPLLALHFVSRHASRLGHPSPGLTDAAIERLLVYKWPGNVRELDNVLERALILADATQIDVEHVAFLDRASGSEGERSRGGLDATLQALERKELIEAMERHGDSKAATARALGINRTTLYYRLRKHGLV